MSYRSTSTVPGTLSTSTIYTCTVHDVFHPLLLDHRHVRGEAFFISIIIIIWIGRFIEVPSAALLIGFRFGLPVGGLTGVYSP